MTSVTVVAKTEQSQPFTWLQAATPSPLTRRAAPDSDCGGYGVRPSSAGPRKRIRYLQVALRLDVGGTFSLEEVSWRDV